MDSPHRKIELQSPADLTFLTTQLRTAARQKLDLHLPPVSDTNEPDELRTHVEELVDAFVAQVLQGMKGNISINGLDVIARGRAGEDDEMEVDSVKGGGVEEVEYEAFDDKLRGKLGSTIAKRDALISQISRHRRTTPGLAASAFQEQFARENEVLLAQTVQVHGGIHNEEGIASVDALQRQEEVQRNWEKAVEGLGRLNKGLTETRARLERVGGVVEYLGGEGK
jgi:kinetochor protein Mis14/NSL1